VENLIEIGTVPGIAALVWGCVELFAKPLSARWKPPLAGALGIAWATAAHIVTGAFIDPLTAIAAGVVAGGLAAGIDSFRKTYQRPTPDAPQTFP